MTTNGEWLEYLANNAPDELAVWFDSEHVETANGTLDGDTDALNAKIAELTAERERYREKFSKCLDYADAIHALMDEGMA